MPNRSQEVDQYMEKLEHPLKEQIETVRDLILALDDHITEQIKWNAPSFCYNGEDRLTMRLHPGNQFQLVFHRGAKAKDNRDFQFEDSTGLLKWVAADRALVTIQDERDLEAKKYALVKVVSQWIKV